MKLLFNVLTAVAAVFPAIAAENGDTVFVDFGELDQSPPVFYNRQRTMPAIMSPQVNTSMAVGEIPFSESVTPSGGKIYNVPVAVSEESRLRPEVSLLYNSQGAEGASCSALGSFGNSFGYNMVSQIANSTITNVVFGQGFDYNSLLGIATGALVGTMIPSYSAFNGSQFANGMAEIGYNTMRGAVTGLASGFVDSALYGNPGLIWQNAVGGAISGGSRSILMNAIFGAPYKPEEIDYKADGLFRGGGLADLISGTGNGVTIGRNLYTNSEITSNETYDGVRFHEIRHLLQQNELGFAKFYGEILKEYIMEVYGSGKLETDAHNYMLEEIGKHNY